mgnify:FL=1
MMSTPHNRGNIGDFAKTVLMPGDPLRAKFIAETFLENPRLVNTVRNMLAYTGTYKGKEVTVMGSGMGMPSIGIYSYELFKFYGVEQIIRIGSCGAFQENMNLFDIIICQGSSTDSNFAAQYQLPGIYSPLASYDLLEKAVASAKKHHANYHVGNILSSDIFYRADGDSWKKWKEMGVLGVEMESYALYCNAAYLHKKALTILTVSDSFISKKETTAEEREKSFTQMMEIALDLI